MLDCMTEEQQNAQVGQLVRENANLLKEIATLECASQSNWRCARYCRAGAKRCTAKFDI